MGSVNKIDDVEAENLRIVFERLDRSDYYEWNLFEKSLTKTRNGKITSLDLSWHGLHHIPSQCFQGLDYLETIRLDNNPHIVFDQDSFVGVPKLNELLIRYCKINEFPKHAFNKDLKLKLIDFSHNPLGQIKEGDFLNLPYLTVLNLSNTNLLEINSHCFQGLYNLEELSLENNMITKIEDEVMMGLYSLLVLNLRNNQIQKLGLQAFKGLSNILEIKLDNNRLDRIPNSTFQLVPTIQHVSLVNNQLTALESIFANHPALTRVDLDTNLIEVVQKKNFANSPHLKFILLQSNLVRDVEDGAVETLSGLEVFNLENNPLEVEAALGLPKQAVFNYVPLIKSASSEEIHKWVVDHYENKRLVEQILRTKRVNEKTRAFLRLVGFYLRD